MAQSGGKPTRRWLRPTIFGAVLLIIAVGGGYLLLRGHNMAVLNPQGEVGKKELQLMILTVIIGLAVIIPVFIMLFSFAWKYRETNPKTLHYNPDHDDNRWIEFVWWGIPIVIIGALSVITWFSSHDLDPYKPLASDKKPINVQVIAMEWKWLFIYPDYGIAAVNEVRLPVGTPVNFSITADAPMSAFWIPSLGTQIYAMNGMTSQLKLEADHTGSYYGTNTNINGTGYARMTFTADAMSDSSFNSWVKHTASSSTQPLNLGTYNKLAQPSMSVPVSYYQVHDSSIFQDVLNKYMGGTMGSMTMGGM